MVILMVAKKELSDVNGRSTDRYLTIRVLVSLVVDINLS